MADTTALKLPENTNQAFCERLASELQAMRGQPLLLDAGDVNQISALSAQLLAVARRSWAADRAEMQVLNPSEGFCKSLERLGLTHAIMGEG